jgi:hypothetical protein
VSTAALRRGEKVILVPPSIRTAIALLSLALLATACSGGSGDRTTETTAQAGQDKLAVEVGSYDLTADKKTRFLVGLIAQDNEFVSYGTIKLGFAFLGKDQPASTGQTTITATGRFLPIPGSQPAEGKTGPVALAAANARGVYVAEVTFDQPGYWGVLVNADLQGQGAASATATFQVLAKNQVPAVGDPALRTRNHTVASKGIPKGAIDSRARTEGKIPDPVLHQGTIAEAIAERRPVVTVFSTPVYCVSRFCGPITDLVADLAPKYPKAEFIHVEVWRDYDKREVNKAAADWLLRRGDLHEPWVFVIGPDGKVTARFDNVATKAEIEAALKDLPAGP